MGTEQVWITLDQGVESCFVCAQTRSMHVRYEDISPKLAMYEGAIASTSTVILVHFANSGELNYSGLLPGH